MNIIFESLRREIEKEGEILRLDIAKRLAEKTGRSQQECEAFIFRTTNAEIIALDQKLKKEA